MNSALIGLAAQVGTPFVKNLLERKLGPKNAELAAEVMGEIAGRVGVLPSELEAIAASAPDRIVGVLPEVETAVAARVAIYASEMEYQIEALKIHQNDPAWMRAWRPGGMYLIGFLWLWNIVILHVANAYWKIALPPMNLDVLLGLSALYFSLYMGGHTVKDVMEKWVRK